MSDTEFWNIFVITGKGDNVFELVHATPENIVFTIKNVDRAGWTIYLIFVVSKNDCGFSDVVTEVLPYKQRLSQIHTPSIVSRYFQTPPH